jgi:hypothetical protein
MSEQRIKTIRNGLLIVMKSIWSQKEKILDFGPIAKGAKKGSDQWRVNTEFFAKPHKIR